MADRDLNFNVGANGDKASKTFAEIAGEVDRLADKILKLGGISAKPSVLLTTDQVQRQIDDVKRKLDELKAKKADPTVDAHIELAQQKLEKLQVELDALNRRTGGPKIDADIAAAQVKIDELTKKLDDLRTKRTDPVISAQIDAFEKNIAKVENELTGLRSKRADPVIDAKIANGLLKIEQMKAKLEELNRQRADPIVEAQITDAEAKLTLVIDEMDRLKLERANVPVDADITALESKIAIATAELDRLKAKKVTPKVDADIAAFTAKLAALEELMKRTRVAGGAIKVSGSADAEKLASSVSKADGELKKADASAKKLGVSMGALSGLAALAPGGTRATGGALGTAVVGAAPGIISLASSLEQLVGVLGLVPAGAAFAATGLVVLRESFKNFTAAIGPRDTAQQIVAADEAMKTLGAQAQVTAKDLIALGPAWRSLRDVMQNNLLGGLGPELKQLSNEYLPVLKTGLGGIATAFHNVGVNVLDWLKADQQVNDAVGLFNTFRLTIEKLRPGLLAIVDAFKNIEVVGASFLPGFSQSFTNLTVKFDQFTSKARADGSLQKWIANGVVALDQLGRLLLNVGSILNSVFTAARASGTPLLQVLSEATTLVANFLKSGQGQTALITVFTGLNQLITSLEPAVKALLSAVAQGVIALAPAFKPVGEAINAIGLAIAPIIPLVANFAGPVLASLAKAVTAIVQAVGSLTPLFGPLVGLATAIFPPIIDFITRIITAISGLGPLIPIVLNLAIAWKVFGSLSGSVIAAGVAVGDFGTKVGLAATKFGPAEAAANKFATGMTSVGNVIGKVGTALPVIGLAVLAFAALWDAVKDHAASAAQEVVNGSKTYAQAVQEETAALQAQNFWLGTNATNQSVYNDSLGAYTGRIATVSAASQKFAADQANAAAQGKVLADSQNASGSAVNKAGLEMGAASQKSADLANAQNTAAAAGQQFHDQTVRVSDSISKADQEMGKVVGTGVQLQNVYSTNATASDTLAVAQGKVDQALRTTLSAMNPLQVAQANVTILEGRYQDALKATGADSDTTKDAANRLSVAREILAKATDSETLATKSATQALIDNANEVAAAAHAATGMQQADLNLEKQIATTRDTLKTHTTASVEGRQATIDLTNAYFADAQAAGDLAAANDVGKSAQDKARDSAIAYRQKLIDLAATTTGPVHAALIDAINKLDGSGNSAATAAGQVDGLNKSLRALPAQITTNIQVNAQGSYQLPGSTGAASNPLRQANAPGGAYAEGGIAPEGPFMGYAASGRIMPGYTPGRDVFTIAVSGGEAIMRPEWTRSVGAGYINTANSAARSGASIPPPPAYANGGVADVPVGQRYATGGIAIQASQAGPKEIDLTLRAEADALAAAIKQAIATIIAAAQTAAASVAGGIPAGHAANVAVVQAAANSYGWGSGAEWNALVAVINRESGFNNVAQNPTSTAYGMFQFLDSTWASYGAAKTSDPSAQTAAGLRYISQRYGDPLGALAHENAYGWYDNGGIANGVGFLQKMTQEPERVLSPDQTRSFESLVGWLTSSTKTPQIANGGSSGSGSETAAEVIRLRGEIRALGETIKTSVADARPITVEDRSGNPVETGRAVSLALRL